MLKSHYITKYYETETWGVIFRNIM